MSIVLNTFHFSSILFLILMNFSFVQGNDSTIKESLKLGIREAIVSDSEHIAILLMQLGYEISPGQVAEKIQLFSKNDHDKIWVALVDGLIRGALSFNVINLLELTQPIGRIDILSVDQSFRRMGIGKALVEVAENYAKHIGCAGVILTSRNSRHEAHQFYKSLGYQIPETTYFKKTFN
jgi:GNAT superfamily N-acetyltransferase